MRWRHGALGLLGALLLGDAGAAVDHGRHRQDAPQVLAPGYQALGYEAPEPGTYRLPTLGEAEDGVLLDSRGTPQQLRDLYGDKVVVLSFIYTSCSDVNGCPLATHVLSQVQKRIAGDARLRNAVRLISVSFDPRNDTPEIMAEYRDTFARADVDWRFLTAESEADLAPLLEAYGQSLKKDYDAEGNFVGSFSHILRVYLIDRAARIRNIYSVSFLHADTLLSDIRTVLLAEAAADSAGIPAPLRQGPGDDKRGYETADYATQSRSLSNRKGRPADLLQFVRRPPLGLPPVPSPEDNPVTPARVELGRKLFFDRRLSHNNTISCAMCHVPEQGFTVNEMATAVGIEGRSVRRNAPTLYNVAFAQGIFHDARESTLEQQIWSPLLASNEMGNPSVGYVIDRVRGLADYAGLFEDAFDGRRPGMETLGMAIASYERTLVSANSRFDRWYFAGQQDALTPAEQHGFELFTGRAGCSACHTLEGEQALFTDNALHNTGVGYRAAFGVPESGTITLAPGETLSVTAVPPDRTNDLGRYEITLDPDDRWKYKTPTLRNVALTAPYMHDGSIGSLRAVVEHYNGGGVANETLDPLIRPLSLNATEIDDLAAFLRALTGDNVDVIVADAFAAPIGDP
ncbi:MAG: cytochrome c peroxidase [Gammaproteobacteria bacterium]